MNICTPLMKEEKRRFYDYSMIPNPDIYGHDATPHQIETLRKFFEINHDGTFLPKLYMKNSEETLEKVLEHSTDAWHRVL